MHGVHTQRRAQDGAIVLKEIKKNAAGKVQEAVCNDDAHERADVAWYAQRAVCKGWNQRRRSREKEQQERERERERGEGAAEARGW